MLFRTAMFFRLRIIVCWQPARAPAAGRERRQARHSWRFLSRELPGLHRGNPRDSRRSSQSLAGPAKLRARSEEHTSELQSLRHLVCRLLLEKKKTKKNRNID